MLDHIFKTASGLCLLFPGICLYLFYDEMMFFQMSHSEGELSNYPMFSHPTEHFTLDSYWFDG